MPSRPLAATRAAFAAVASGATSTFAFAQSSASFRVDAAVDTGGGRSTSTNHIVTSCLGSEIAGSQSSASFRVDSGCGATALAVVRPNANGASGGGVLGVPTLTDAGVAILVAVLAVVAARKLVRR